MDRGEREEDTRERGRKRGKDRESEGEAIILICC